MDLLRQSLPGGKLVDPTNGQEFGVPGYKEGAAAQKAKDHVKDGEEKISPLTLDLDGDGLDLISVADSTAFFDLDNDGFVERVGWVGADDALLAIDLDDNGYIETRNELFGGSPSDGFASLRLLDSNADNVIDASDAAFADLKVWRDLNGNGVSEAGELQSLTAAGIASISLASVHLTTPQTIAGNSVTDTSTFTWTAGGTGTIADVWFSVNQAFSFDARPVEIVPEALVLPTLRGYGIISGLTAQMSRDATLLDLVQDFVETPIADVTDAQIRDIMYRWAEVDGISPTARGPYIDARQLTFLERFLDQPFLQNGWGTNPGVNATADLEAAFAAVQRAVAAHLFVQAQLSDVVGIGAYDYLSDSVVIADLEAALELAGTAAAAVSGGFDAKLAWWKHVSPIFNDAAPTQETPTADYETWFLAATAAGLGFALASADVGKFEVRGTSSAETRNGTTAADMVIGGAGNDTLNGGQGDDVYLFARGDGQDRVVDAAGNDALTLAADILPGDVTLSRAGAAANDLVISVAGGGQVTIVNYFWLDYSSNYSNRIEQIRFADGTSWDYDAVFGIVTSGTVGNDTLHGDEASNAFGGAAGNDWLYGRDGADTLGGGDGLDTLEGGEGDDLLQGGAGNDSLFGGASYTSTAGNDTLEGGIGNDTLNAGNGADVYFFSLGDGQDRILDTSGDDAVAFAADILPRDVILSRAGAAANDLVINVAGGGQVTIVNYFWLDYSSNYSNRIEDVRFADGTVWDYDELFGILTTGAAGNDTLYGDEAANAFGGAAGNDWLYGRDGADTLDGGDSADKLDGEEGDDHLRGGAGNDSLFGGTSYYNTAGNDTLEGGAGSDTLNAGKGDDVYFFSRGDGQDIISEPDNSTTNGIDTISFAPDIAPGDITLSRAGSNADDLVISIAGGDQVTVKAYFTAGLWDTYASRIEAINFASGTSWDYASILTRLTTGTAGADILISDQNHNTISGLDGNDTIDGRAGNDTLDGGAGNDRLLAGVGNDVANGGTGLDTLDGGAGNDLLEGGDGADSIFGGYDLHVGGGNDTIVGSLGNDTLNGGDSDDLYTFNLGDGQDRIVETAGGVDTISFAAGIVPGAITVSRAGTNLDDLVMAVAGGGQVTVQAYFTRDFYGNYSSQIEQIRFDDTTLWDYASVLASVTTITAGNDRVIGDHVADAFDGLGGNDTIEGRDGNDTLDGGLGNDRLVGGTGDDLYFVDSSTDVVVEIAAQGSDEVRAAASSLTLGANVERLVYVGSGNFAGTGHSSAETIYGGAGADTLRGVAGNDDLRGGDGADVLVGGAGADTLTGGAGADTFRYEVASEPGLAANADRVLDFTQADGDLINLSAIDANTTVGGDQAFSFIGTAAFASGTRGQLRFENRVDGNTWVQADLDGNQVADFEIVLIGSKTLTAGDFVL
ncbi:calcium-binding protein [Roseomonas sp. CECT 9278]|uniref:calcium-binding protein n=1 Tax=Roseomonas sp. CECT 9278 TaxID=2845823 RepID=UPI001E39F6AE|nr:calcium-binding protein [Roseomonas sp. CECT 9278]CAH0150237.1 hypothetical protein ROS9278_00700 [Roseomonas sp. CECT 9278]